MEENVSLSEIGKRVNEVFLLIERHGMTDGAHHKQWVLDQILRALLKDLYQDWLKNRCDEWDQGIAP
jgi:hypothetical protein